MKQIQNTTQKQSPPLVQKISKWLKITIYIILGIQVLYLIRLFIGDYLYNLDLIYDPSIKTRYLVSGAVTLKLLFYNIVYIGFAGLLILLLRLFRPEKFRAWAQTLVKLVFVLAAIWFFRTMFINPLPKDEYFINLLQDNRKEIEQLVQWTLHCKDPHLEQYAPHVREFFQKISDCKEGIRERKEKFKPYVSLKSRLNVRIGINDVDIWLPNPYSEEARLRRKEKYDALRSRSDGDREKSLKLIHEFRSCCLAATVEQSCWPYKFAWAWGSGFLDPIRKELYYVPQVPIVEDGRLWLPITAEGEIRKHLRVFDSLNSYPSRYWKRGECVYRQIEPQWFIRMCKAYL